MDIEKKECKNCGGSGYTSEHNPDDPHTDEQGNSIGCSGNCPIQVECNDCEATGLIK